MTDPRQTYSFGPLERRGIFGAVRAGQVAALAVGALTAILVLDRTPSAGGALMAIAACALAARRRSPRWAAARCRSGRRWRCVSPDGGSAVATAFARRSPRPASWRAAAS